MCRDETLVPVGRTAKSGNVRRSHIATCRSMWNHRVPGRLVKFSEVLEPSWQMIPARCRASSKSERQLQLCVELTGSLQHRCSIFTIPQTNPIYASDAIFP